MLAIVALLAIAFVLTARTEVKSGSAYNDQAVAKALAKMAVDRAAMELYRQNKGTCVSGGEVAITYTNSAWQSVILIYSTNDFTKLDNYTNDTSLLNFGTLTLPYGPKGYDYIDRDGQTGRNTLEPYWIGVRDNNGVLRGRFAYVALGNLVDLNAIGNINIWATSPNNFYMRPADTNFGYGYIGNSNTYSGVISTRGICPDISLPKFLLKLGYSPATVNTSAYSIVAYRYGWKMPSSGGGAPWLYNTGGNSVYPGDGSIDLNGDGVVANPTDYRVYPSPYSKNYLITDLSQIWTIPIDIGATPSWGPHYGGHPLTPDPACTNPANNLANYATVALSADPNLVGVYVGSRVNLNLMTNGAALNNTILSNSVVQLTNVLGKFPQFTNNYNNNLAQVNNKLIQIALNLIDFHTTNRYPSVFTNVVSATTTNVLTGIKPTPYINQVYIRYDTLFYRSTNVGGANAGKTNYWFSTSVAMTNELWNPYPTTFADTNNLVVTNITIISTNTTAKSYSNSWTASCIFTSPVRGYTITGVPPAINTNVYRTTLGLGNVMAVGYYSNATPGVVPGTIIITNIFVTAKLYGLTNANYAAYLSSNLIQQIAVSVTNVLTNAWPAWAAWNSMSWNAGGNGTTNIGTNSVINLVNLEADDPRMGILYTQQLVTAGNYNLGAMNVNCNPTNYLTGNLLPPVASTNLDTWYREGTNSFFIKTNISKKVVANAYVSVGEIGYVHRGEPWATIRLQPFTTWATATVPATNYLYGEGKLLDYFRVNDLIDVAGRINLNTDTNGPVYTGCINNGINQSPALFALFSGITNSWYTNSAYANLIPPGSGNTIDGVTDDKITAIIKEIGDYRACMTNGAANYTGQDNLMTYVGELCAISNLTTYTDKNGNTQPISYTDDANREALIRAVANLVTTWEGGGASVILAWGQVIKGGGTTWGDNTNGTPGQIVKIQATFQVVNGKIQMTSYQYIP